MTDADKSDDDLNLVELFAGTRDRSVRRLPHLVIGGLRLVARASRREFIINAALQVVAGAGLAGQVLFGRHLLGRVAILDRTSSLSDIALPLLGLAVATTAVSVAGFVRVEQQKLMGELVARYATGQVIEVATAADLVAFDSPTFHNRLQRARTNASARPTQMANGLLGMISALVSLTGIATALAIIEPIFLLILIVAYLPLWLATTRASRVAYAFSVEQTERDRRRDYLAMVLTGRQEAAEVRAFALAEFLRQRYDQLYAERIHDLRHMVWHRTKSALAGGVITTLLNAATIACLAQFVISGRLSFASAGAAAAAIVLFAGRLAGLAGAAGSLYESSLFIEDFTTFVDEMPRLKARRPTSPAPAGFDELVVRDLSFAYPSRPGLVLSDISLRIARGEIIALVGENGSGKTTLAKLLAGLYAPAAGSISWDDTDLATCDPTTIHQSIGVIFQDYVKYMLSVHDNIASGRSERIADHDAVADAADRALADEFIAGLSRGYETQLGTQFWGGQELSIGQWQRIALARAFFRDAPFLILDEPTAALDPRAEAELFERMRSLYSGRTVLLISHRFSTVRTADRIYVLSAGRIVEDGTHEELMASEGLYAELFTLQASGFVEP